MLLKSASVTTDDLPNVTITAYIGSGGQRQFSIECNTDEAKKFIAALGKPTYDEPFTTTRMLTYEAAVAGNILDDLARFCDVLRGMADLEHAPVTLVYHVSRLHTRPRMSMTFYADNVVSVKLTPWLYSGRRMRRRLSNIRRTELVRYCKLDHTIIIAMTDAAVASTDSILASCKRFARILN